ncbi:SCO6745 family protein [Streptomyces zagrosensis]|uniref:SalK n=1 Tax=Streptomyces zagrosensis TaxID=1042984 RepID=A0A7W9QDA4_9ACTN|nr:hypothetical protein [Streptomyces zagrosensis]MBB5937809.1 hypothetical protein [Streptomyces zagrosensis]
MSEAEATARALWPLVEPLHAVSYFAPDAHAPFHEAGLKGFWPGYFVGRAAPLGPVGPEPVVAAFFSFAPAMVRRALPALWQTVSPQQALKLRLTGAEVALRRLLAGREAAARQAADELGALATELDCAGRVLAAANTALPTPDEPLRRLWHAATLLREHRGDGHLAALVAAGLDGCEALVLRTGIDLPRAELQPYRGWTDAEWDAATERLAERGLLAADSAATARGRQLLLDIEQATNRAAQRPWQDVSATRRERLTDLLTPLARACAGALRFPNPIGLPAPNPT